MYTKRENAATAESNKVRTFLFFAFVIDDKLARTG
jgi:hypothetical protein